MFKNTFTQTPVAPTRLYQEINSTFNTQEFSFGVLGISHNNDIISSCGTTGHTDAVL